MSVSSKIAMPLQKCNWHRVKSQQHRVLIYRILYLEVYLCKHVLSLRNFITDQINGHVHVFACIFTHHPNL